MFSFGEEWQLRLGLTNVAQDSLELMILLLLQELCVCHPAQLSIYLLYFVLFHDFLKTKT